MDMVLALLFAFICVSQHINAVYGQITSTSATTTVSTYQTPNSTYSACGPNSFMLMMGLMFLVLIILHSLIFGVLLKKFLEKKKKSPR